MDMRVVNSKVMTNLILTGCFDYLGHSRSVLLDYYERLNSQYQDINTQVHGNDKRKTPTVNVQLFWEPLKEVKMIERAEYPINQILAYEKELTGLYLSGHPLDFCRNMITPLITHTAGTLEEAGVGGYVTVAGLVNSVRNTTIKKGKSKGKLMAFVELEDVEGVMEITVFAEIYSKYSAILVPGSVCLIRGEVSQYKDSFNIVANTIRLVEYDHDEQTHEIKSSSLIIMSDESVPYKELKEMTEMIREYSGMQKVILCRVNREPCSLFVTANVNDELLDKIRGYEWVIDAWDGNLSEMGEVA
jgi:DNA polymerase-3 subunit alpha